jgi:hypothetical protein
MQNCTTQQKDEIKKTNMMAKMHLKLIVIDLKTIRRLE